MDRSKIAARFVAFVCYLNSDTKELRCPEEAGRYAMGNWKSFLPYVHDDLGRFFAARPPSKAQTGRRPAAASKVG
jgi:hypothetical protein